MWRRIKPVSSNRQPALSANVISAMSKLSHAGRRSANVRPRKLQSAQPTAAREKHARRTTDPINPTATKRAAPPSGGIHSGERNDQQNCPAVDEHKKTPGRLQRIRGAS